MSAHGVCGYELWGARRKLRWRPYCVTQINSYRILQSYKSIYLCLEVMSFCFVFFNGAICWSDMLYILTCIHIMHVQDVFRLFRVWFFLGWVEWRFFSTSTQQESHCHSCKLLVKVTDSIVFVTDHIFIFLLWLVPRFMKAKCLSLAWYNYVQLDSCCSV